MSRSLPGLLRRIAEDHPDAVAAYDAAGDPTARSPAALLDTTARSPAALLDPATFARLQEIAGAVRAALPDGVRRVGLVIPNRLEGVAAVHAVWQHGATAVLLSPLLPRAEQERRAGETSCEVLLDPLALDSVETLGPGPEVPVDGEAVVIFTSGTSGRPKAAVLTFAGIEASIASIAEGAGIDLDGRSPQDPPRSPTPVFVPLAHVGGLLAAINASFLGKPFVVFDKFRAEEAFDIVARFGLRLLRLTPAMIFDLAHWPEERSLAPVATVTTGSAPLAEDTRDRFERRYGVRVLQSYGQTELAGAIAFERYDDVRAGRRPPGSVGRIAPGMEVRIVDAEGREQPPGEVGEIHARSRSALAAYIADGATVDPKADGWHATGDLGFVDGDGFLSVLGRADHTILCGGFNVYPAMVEAALARQPGVADAVVTGVEDPRLGEVPVALVVAEAGTELDVEDVRASLRGELAAYEIPRAIRVVDRLPLTPGGKPDRDAARQLLTLEPRGK